MEIYNEEINDLLAPEHRKLQIHESIEVVYAPPLVLNYCYPDKYCLILVISFINEAWNICSWLKRRDCCLSWASPRTYGVRRVWVSKFLSLILSLYFLFKVIFQGPNSFSSSSAYVTLLFSLVLTSFHIQYLFTYATPLPMIRLSRSLNRKRWPNYPVF